MKCTIKTIAIIMALFIATSLWAVPNTINFQGALKDADGVPVNDTKYMDFRIYDDPDTGTLLWSEDHAAVVISAGIFSEELGVAEPFPADLFDNTALYITFYVGGEEMAPRQKLLSVPYAVKADKAVNAATALIASTVGGVPLSGLVQQDGSGNATITGTMTADAFIGDGSGLTNISSAAFDSIYVNTTGPDTITAHTTLGALNIINTRTVSKGIKIIEAGDGVYVDSVRYDGVEIKYAGDCGIEITSVDNDGVYVNEAGDDGVYVKNAGDDGVYVYHAGNPSTQQTSSYKNGFEVAGAQGNGLYVGRADNDGVYVDSAGDDGVHVDYAGDDGVYVNSAGDDGFNVYHAGTPSTQNVSTSKNGFEVAGAQGNGLYVGRADNDGVYVYSAFGFGVCVHSVGFDGVYANTIDANHEYGIYTPDKMYAGSGYYGGKSGTFGRNTGSRTLEPGDLVCISGGYEENVLGEDGVPVVNIAKANSRNSEAIFGVVEYKVYIREEIEELEEGKTEIQKSFRFAEGDVMSGDYLAIIVFGPVDVKVDSRSDIKTGESVVAGDGVARKIRTTEVNGITIAENVGILGKALEDSNGKGKIKVYVNCK